MPGLRVIDQLSETPQAIQDQQQGVSQVFLTTNGLAIGSEAKALSGFSIVQTPAESKAHLSLGDPVATAGVASAKLSFSGFGIEHAGFVWIPQGQLSGGKLHLTFGGRDDPTPRGQQPARVTFQANGNVGIGTTTPSELLEVNGNVLVSGDIRLAGADCAEEFDVALDPATEPGTVMVIGDEERLQRCSRAYDRRVAGVLSGAGNYRPGFVLGKDPSKTDRLALALCGRVYCKVDAGHASIDIGDLLTSSTTPGHAMKASDPRRAFGAVIGKALSALPAGTGVIPILVALQ
jgi:hypothetical protein